MDDNTPASPRQCNSISFTEQCHFQTLFAKEQRLNIEEKYACARCAHQFTISRACRTTRNPAPEPHHHSKEEIHLCTIFKEQQILRDNQSSCRSDCRIGVSPNTCSSKSIPPQQGEICDSAINSCHMPKALHASQHVAIQSNVESSFDIHQVLSDESENRDKSDPTSKLSSYYCIEKHCQKRFQPVALGVRLPRIQLCHKQRGDNMGTSKNAINRQTSSCHFKRKRENDDPISPPGKRLCLENIAINSLANNSSLCQKDKSSYEPPQEGQVNYAAKEHPLGNYGSKPTTAMPDNDSDRKKAPKSDDITTQRKQETRYVSSLPDVQNLFSDIESLSGTPARNTANTSHAIEEIIGLLEDETVPDAMPTSAPRNKSESEEFIQMPSFSVSPRSSALKDSFGKHLGSDNAVLCLNAKKDNENQFACVKKILFPSGTQQEASDAVKQNLSKHVEMETALSPSIQTLKSVDAELCIYDRFSARTDKMSTSQSKGEAAITVVDSRGGRGKGDLERTTRDCENNDAKVVEPRETCVKDRGESEERVAGSGDHPIRDHEQIVEDGGIRTGVCGGSKGHTETIQRMLDKSSECDARETSTMHVSLNQQTSVVSAQGCSLLCVADNPHNISPVSSAPQLSDTQIPSSVKLNKDAHVNRNVPDKRPLKKLVFGDPVRISAKKSCDKQISSSPENVVVDISDSESDTLSYSFESHDCDNLSASDEDCVPSETSADRSGEVPVLVFKHLTVKVKRLTGVEVRELKRSLKDSNNNCADVVTHSVDETYTADKVYTAAEEDTGVESGTTEEMDTGEELDTAEKNNTQDENDTYKRIETAEEPKVMNSNGKKSKGMVEKDTARVVSDTIQREVIISIGSSSDEDEDVVIEDSSEEQEMAETASEDENRSDKMLVQEDGSAESGGDRTNISSGKGVGQEVITDENSNRADTGDLRQETEEQITKTRVAETSSDCEGTDKLEIGWENDSESSNQFDEVSEQSSRGNEVNTEDENNICSIADGGSKACSIRCAEFENGDKYNVEHVRAVNLESDTENADVCVPVEPCNIENMSENDKERHGSAENNLEDCDKVVDGFERQDNSPGKEDGDSNDLNLHFEASDTESDYRDISRPAELVPQGGNVSDSNNGKGVVQETSEKDIEVIIDRIVHEVESLQSEKDTEQEDEGIDMDRCSENEIDVERDKTMGDIGAQNEEGDENACQKSLNEMACRKSFQAGNEMRVENLGQCESAQTRAEDCFSCTKNSVNLHDGETVSRKETDTETVTLSDKESFNCRLHKTNMGNKNNNREVYNGCEDDVIFVSSTSRTVKPEIEKIDEQSNIPNTENQTSERNEVDLEEENYKREADGSVNIVLNGVKKRLKLPPINITPDVNTLSYMSHPSSHQDTHYAHRSAAHMAEFQVPVTGAQRQAAFTGAHMIEVSAGKKQVPTAGAQVQVANTDMLASSNPFLHQNECNSSEESSSMERQFQEFMAVNISTRPTLQPKQRRPSPAEYHPLPIWAAKQRAHQRFYQTLQQARTQNIYQQQQTARQTTQPQVTQANALEWQQMRQYLSEQRSYQTQAQSFAQPTSQMRYERLQHASQPVVTQSMSQPFTQTGAQHVSQMTPQMTYHDTTQQVSHLPSFLPQSRTGDLSQMAHVSRQMAHQMAQWMQYRTQHVTQNGEQCQTQPMSQPVTHVTNPVSQPVTQHVTQEFTQLMSKHGEHSGVQLRTKPMSQPVTHHSLLPHGPNPVKQPMPREVVQQVLHLQSQKQPAYTDIIAQITHRVYQELSDQDPLKQIHTECAQQMTSLHLQDMTQTQKQPQNNQQ